MKTVRRQFTVVQTRKMEEAYRQIFRGIYYRHEFARRHADVFKAGDSLPRMLGLPDERFRTFIKNNRCLTDDIIRAVEGTKGRTKGLRREKLGKYLAKHKVIPMTWTWGEMRPFFPRELFTQTQSWLHHCFSIFNALMKFEAYAIAVLKIGQPIMFPMAMLRVGLKGEAGIKDVVVSNLHVEEYEAPMFLDFTAPKTAFDAYCDAFTHQLNTHVREPTENDGIERLKEPVLDQHLEVYDVARPWVAGRRDTAILHLYARRQKLDMKNLSLHSDFKTASEWFSQKLKMAKPYVEGYLDII